MKAISLWQPWASAWAHGLKLNETRDWFTSHRGLLLIHAAKTRQGLEIIGDLNDPEDFWGQLLCVLGPTNEMAMQAMPFGAIVGVVDLFAVSRTENLSYARTLADVRDHEGGHSWITPREYSFGNYGPGRFAWHGCNHAALKEPIPYRGAQGFFDVPDELLPPEVLR